MRRVSSEWVLRGALVVSAALALAGCFKGDFANCAVTCATSADCPGGLACNAQGFCSSGGGACMMPDADLTQPQPLTVTTSGDGTVASAPSGIDCGSTCMAEYPPLSSVMLTATPGANSVFEGWTGDCASSSSPECALTMDGPKTAGAQFAQHGAVRWVKQVSFSGQDFFDSHVDLDQDGNVITVGGVDDNGVDAIYAVKYSKADGAIVWEKKIDAPEGFSFTIGGSATDIAGNVYLCMRFQGANASTTINGVNVTGDLFGNILAMRLNAGSGNIDWVKQWGGTGQETCGGAVVQANDVFFTGYTSSSPSTFDGVVLTGAQTNSAFIVKAATSNGTVSAGQVLVGNFSIYAAAGNAGQVAIGGIVRASYSGLANCGINISGTGDDGFFMVFNNNLSCAFAKSYGSLTNGQNTATFGLAPVPGGGWLATGSFQGPVLFAQSGTSIANQGGYDAYIARYNSSGQHVYSFGYGTAASETGRGVAMLPTGEVVFAGEFGSSISFGATTLTGTNDVFITRLSAGLTPVHQWATKVGGQAYEIVNDIAVDASGTINVVAYWTGMSDVGGMPLTAQDYDGWTASFVR